MIKPKKLSSSFFNLSYIFLFKANSTMLVYGMESGWISPITALLQSGDSPVGYPMNDDELSWTASVLSITATFGTVIYSYIADRYGRKISVIIIAFLEGVSGIISCKLDHLN